MNIVYTLNDNFMPQVAASITSICENNKDFDEIVFYLMTLNVSIENQEKIIRHVNGYDRQIEIIELESISKYFDFSIDTSGWNPIVLARLVLDKLLPDTVDRLLYLDGDTIVRGSLAELWASDMGENVIGAVPEPTCDVIRKKNLGLEGKPYYNAGILLINMYLWRKNKSGLKILDYYKKNNGKLFANDQDAINATLIDCTYRLSPRYNYCNTYNFYSYNFLAKLTDYQFISEEEYSDVVNNPCIVHYLGEERPWRRGNHHKYKSDYLYYLNKTPWANYEEGGWELYFLLWDAFNIVMKPFSSLRYKIINAMIPKFLEVRAIRRK